MAEYLPHTQPSWPQASSRTHSYIFFFLQAMKQRTRAMGFLKTIFEDGVDCILTPGEYVGAGIARERSNARYVINAFSSSIIMVQTAYSWNDHERAGKKLSGVGNQLENCDGRSLIINDMLSGWSDVLTEFYPGNLALGRKGDVGVLLDGSASDWKKHFQPMRSTSQMWVVTRHRYEVSALVFLIHYFAGKHVRPVVVLRNVGCFLSLLLWRQSWT